MRFLDKRFLPLAIFGILYFMLMVLINLYIQGQVSVPLEESIRISVPSSPVGTSRKPEQSVEKNKKGLLPDDPSKYNILEYKSHHIPQTQPQWDYFMNETLIDSQVLDHMKREEFFRGLQKSSQEFNRQMGRVDSLIRTLEKTMQESPSQETRDRLQNLYMLRSTLERLKNTVVKD